MLAGFSFDLSRVRLCIGGGGLRKKDAVWVADCKTNFEDVTTDSWPVRGDVSFLNRYPAEITILPFSLADVERHFYDAGRALRVAKRFKAGSVGDFYEAGIAERIAKRIEEGYPAPVSALGIRYFSETDETPFLGVTCGIEPNNYEIADKMLQRHLGRSDLMCHIGCIFHGFSEADYLIPNIPTRDEFMAGGYYFCTDNDIPITFYAPGDAQ